MDEALIVNTPYDNAQAFLTLCNEALTAQNILDEQGNPAFLSPTAGSPAWLFALAFGDLYTQYQSRVRDAYNANNAEACSDAKVLDLAVLANVERDTGKASSVPVLLENSDVSPFSAVEGTVISIGELEWILSADVVVPAQSSAYGVLISSAPGAYPVSAGTLLSNPSTYPSTITITTSASSTLGYGYEPIASLRQRIIDGKSSENVVDAVAFALSKLSGLKYCKVFFNPSISADMALPGSYEPLSPRTAKVAVFGSDVDSLIAATYWSIMNVPTQDAHSHVLLRLQASTTQVIATAGDQFTYDGHTWVLTQSVTIPVGQYRVLQAYSVDFANYVVAADSVFVVGTHAVDSEYAGSTITAQEASYYTGESSDFVTSSGQSLPVLYEKAQLKTVSARVLVSAETTVSGYGSYLKTALQAANGSKAPGENFSAQFLSNYLDNFEYASVLGLYLYDDINNIWGLETNLLWNEIAQFTDDSIEIQEV